MKICFLANADHVHTIRWIKYFYDREHEISLVSLHPFNHSLMPRVRFFSYRNLPFQLKPFTTPVNLLFNLVQIRRLLNQIKPDLIHVHSFIHYSWLGYLSGFHPQVITAWGSDILVNPRESRSYKAKVKLAIKKADLITCDAEHIVKPLVELGAAPEKIRQINFGVDTQKFNPQNRNPRIREQLGFSEQPVVISLRSLNPIYDIESLIRAVPLVLAPAPEAKFIIAGEGTLKAQLQELASSLGVSGSVRFVGNLPYGELPQYLTAADVYVSTSLSDAGIAASTAEAMSCSLPVVITDFGDNRKWVEDGVHGYLVPLRSPKALAGRIVDLISHPERRASFGKSARQVIMEKNDLYREMGKMETLYQQLIEKRG